MEEFLRRRIYPMNISKDKGKRANFRRTCRNFSLKNGELFYKDSRKVIYRDRFLVIFQKSVLNVRISIETPIFSKL